MIEADFLYEVEPTIEHAYARHMETALKNGRPFDPTEVLARAAGTPNDNLLYGPVVRESFQAHCTNMADTFGIDVRPVLAASYLVNTLTEDNLPHYTSRIQSKVVSSPALMAFSNEWTAEEDAHGVIMRDYAQFADLIGSSPKSVISQEDYYKGRVQQLRTGTEINPPNMFNAFAYLTLQEHLTKEAHNKTRWLLDPIGKQVIGPISGDEQNHYEFYRTLHQAALDFEPDTTLSETERVYRRFRMPGRRGIPDFDAHSLTIGLSGIFDLATIRQSMRTITEKIDIEGADPITDSGKKAQESILEFTSKESIQNQHELMEALRDKSDTILPNGMRNFILGKTVQFTTIGTATGPRITGLESIVA